MNDYYSNLAWCIIFAILALANFLFATRAKGIPKWSRYVNWAGVGSCSIAFTIHFLRLV